MFYGFSSSSAKMFPLLAAPVLLPLANAHSTNAQVTQLRICLCTYMSTYVYINACLAYRFGKATACLHQRLFMSTLRYINYQNINALFIAKLLYINLQYRSSKPVLRIRTLTRSGSSSKCCDVDNKYFVKVIVFWVRLG
jgi:hypothetical protein